MNPTYISDWTVFQGKLGDEIDAGVKAGEIETTDTMWRGPSGDYVVASDPAELTEEYADYTDAGTVAEYLHDED